MSQGLFISFEGIDGAGKSSHVESLAGLRDARLVGYEGRDSGAIRP